MQCFENGLLPLHLRDGIQGSSWLVPSSLQIWANLCSSPLTETHSVGWERKQARVITLNLLTCELSLSLVIKSLGTLIRLNLFVFSNSEHYFFSCLKLHILPWVVHQVGNSLKSNLNILTVQHPCQKIIQERLIRFILLHTSERFANHCSMQVKNTAVTIKDYCKYFIITYSNLCIIYSTTI